MKFAALIIITAGLLAGCATADMPDMSPPPPDNPPMPAGGPDWQKVDRTVERVREREGRKARMVETKRTVENVPTKMSQEDYDAVLERARAEIRKANPAMSDTDVEWEATRRADAEKERVERGTTQTASSTYELKKP